MPNTKNSSTVYEILEKIESRKLFLPPIQRPFVWTDEQIEYLFDSIIHGYPFGTMLLWRAKKSVLKNSSIKLREFIKRFSEYDNYDPQECDSFFNQEDYVDAVLDGQQRLMALYTSLCGSVERKIKYKHAKYKESYIVKEMYYDLSRDCFRLLEKAEAHCYLVKNLMSVNQNDYVDWEKELNENYEEEAAEKIKRLYKYVRQEPILHYYQVQSSSIDEALEIFVRINSGGRALSKADLFYSKLVSSWSEAKNKIKELVTKIKDTDFYLRYDYAIRGSLYLIGSSASLKVSEFTENDVQKIKDNWDKIEAALLNACKIAKELGFSSSNLVSENALLPLAYSEYQGYGPTIDKSIVGVQRPEYKKFLIVSQLNGLFSQSTSRTLQEIRTILDKEKTFQYEDLKDVKVGNDCPLAIDAKTINTWMDLKKGEKSKLLLSLLYNLNFDVDQQIHQDHLHPFESFNPKRELYKLEKPDKTPVKREDVERWQEMRDKMPNLQLLPGSVNCSKNDGSLEKWLSNQSNKDYARPLLPDDPFNYGLTNFDVFYQKRKEILIDKLKILLNIP